MPKHRKNPKLTPLDTFPILCNSAFFFHKASATFLSMNKYPKTMCVPINFPKQKFLNYGNERKTLSKLQRPETGRASALELPLAKS